MDFNATIDLIIKDLDETREIIDDLKKYPGVPLLQVELAKSKCKSAGEVIALLKNIREIIPESVPETVQALTQTPPEKHAEKIILIPETSSQPKERKKVQNLSSELKPSPVEKEELTNRSTGKASESAIIADNFSRPSDRINEKLGTMKSEDELSGILKSKHLNNLSEAIGVNDRFLFIREIFNGNKDAYNQAISRLDSAENLSDARAVIMSYTGDNKDNEAVSQLLDLVKRKLPSNE